MGQSLGALARRTGLISLAAVAATVVTAGLIPAAAHAEGRRAEAS